MPKRKYQDVEKLLEQNPGLPIPEAGRKLGYKQELQNKGQGRVGLRNRQVDQERAKAESMQRGEATRYKPPKVSGFDQHHKRMIMLYRPLYEGLSDADALELSKYAAAQGMPLGDVEDNYELLSTGRGGQHDQLHRYMEQQGMRPSDMPDFSKADLDNRKKAFDVLYKDFIQADIDKKSSLLLKGGGVRLNRKQLTMLAAAGVTTYSALGTAASAAETAGRTQMAQESGNPLDYVQAGLSGVSLAGDVVGAFPPAGPVGEAVSTVADVANIGIDVARDPEPLVNVYNKIKEDPLNEAEYLGKQIMGGLKNVAGSIVFGF
tara:strand:- start:55 stop:1011 length:957 start_codon:yes stop_codon:yes gene_type:complete